MTEIVDVLADVVLPAVRAVLEPDEVDAISLGAADDARFAFFPEDCLVDADGDLALVVIARGETFRLRLSPSLADPAVLREHLADQMVDFVAESRFGWGQDRSRPRPWA